MLIAVLLAFWSVASSGQQSGGYGIGGIGASAPRAAGV